MMSVNAFALPPCLRCEVIEEKVEELTGLVRDIHYAAPTGDLCFPQHGCTPDLKWETHPQTCLTKRVVGVIGECD